jgi:midasin
VLGCIESNNACLLEGPPAVGKTSLISALAKLCGGKKLERVNNTDSTTIQDYLGSYLPFGKEFRFQEGALVRALRNGHW